MENKKKTLYTSAWVAAWIILATAVGAFAATNTWVLENVKSMKWEKDVVLDVWSLPVNLTDYVTTHYSGASITKAESEDNTIWVELSTWIELEFDSNGVFLQEEQDNEKQEWYDGGIEDGLNDGEVDDSASDNAWKDTGTEDGLDDGEVNDSASDNAWKDTGIEDGLDDGEVDDSASDNAAIPHQK